MKTENPKKKDCFIHLFPSLQLDGERAIWPTFAGATRQGSIWRSPYRLCGHKQVHRSSRPPWQAIKSSSSEEEKEIPKEGGTEDP